MSWNDAQQYPTPNNAPNECNDQQKSGYDFNSAPIPEGSVPHYGGLAVSGATCGKWPGDKSSKRDVDFLPRGSSNMKRWGNAGGQPQSSSSQGSDSGSGAGVR